MSVLCCWSLLIVKQCQLNVTTNTRDVRGETYRCTTAALACACMWTSGGDGVEAPDWPQRVAVHVEQLDVSCQARRQLASGARPPSTTAILTPACVTASLQWHQHKKSSERATNVENHATFRLVTRGGAVNRSLSVQQYVCVAITKRNGRLNQQQCRNKIMRANWEARAYLITTCHVINSYYKASFVGATATVTVRAKARLTFIDP